MIDIFLVVSISALACAVVLLLRSGLGTIPRILAVLIAASALFLSLGWIAANQFTGNGIDGSILFHLQMGMKGAAFAEFQTQMIFGALSMVALLVLGILVYRNIPAVDGKAPRAARGNAGLALSLVSLLINPGLIDLVRLAQTIRAPSEEVPEKFVLVERLPRIDQPKNFIVLYLEQYERVLLDEHHFPGLAPQLQDLSASSLSFTNIQQVDGASWSIASMTASFCGVPLVGSAAGNSMSGLDHFLPRATCIGDLLSEQGYRLEHMIGHDLDFAGWGNFFRNHGFHSVKGKDELLPDLPPDVQLSPWGLHDQDLLTLAAERIKALAAADQPFGFVLNTLDTHHPHGHAGPGCERQQYREGDDTLLNAFACTDTLTTDWIRSLERAGILENTVLIIASDHLAMPNTIWDRLEPLERTNLLLVLGAGVQAGEVATLGSALDVGATLLELLGYPTNGLGLGRSLIAHADGRAEPIGDVSAAITEGSRYITSLWSYPRIGNEVTIDRSSGQIELGARTIRFPALFMFDESNSVSEIRFAFNGDKSLKQTVRDFAQPRRFLWLDDCTEIAEVHSSIGDGIGETCALLDSGVADLRWFAAIPDLAPISSIELLAPLEDAAGGLRFQAIALDYSEASEPPGMPIAIEDILIRSAGFGNGASYIEDRNTGQRVAFQRGISVAGRRNDGANLVLLGHADTCAIEVETEDLEPNNFQIKSHLPKLSEGYELLFVVVHDSAFCFRYPMSEVFAGTDFLQGKKINFREPYIGILNQDGRPFELAGPAETAITLETSDPAE